MTCVAWLEMQHADLVIMKSEAALQMRMPEESNLRRRVQQAIERLGRCEDVLVLVLVGAVDHHEAIYGERSDGQFFQPLAIFRAQLVACPQGHRARYRIEVVGIGETRSGFIVIAANGDGSEFADAIHRFVGIRTVTDDVAETHHFLPTAFGRVQRRIQRRQVRVDVTED